MKLYYCSSFLFRIFSVTKQTPLRELSFEQYSKIQHFLDQNNNNYKHKGTSTIEPAAVSANTFPAWPSDKIFLQTNLHFYIVFQIMNFLFLLWAQVFYRRMRGRPKDSNLSDRIKDGKKRRGNILNFGFLNV